MKCTIIIVGAGASGLMAARELSAKKYKVIILESQNNCGGRIQTHQENEVVVEAGAEFVHGKLPVTLNLCEEAGIEYIPVEGKMYRKDRNQWVEETEMIEGWNELVRKMGSLREDMTLDKFLAKYYPEDKYTDLRMHITSFVQGFDLADPKRVSVKGLHKEWSKEEEENFRLTQGYKKLIDFLEEKCLQNGCTIIKGDAVRQVDWQKNDVTAYTNAGKKYNAEKIIITVPLGVLTNISGHSSINFTPPVDNYIHAAADIGYGTVIKFVFHFKNIYWKEDTRFIFSEEVIPTWWTQYPFKNNLLTGWAGGPRASNLKQHSEEELFEIALASLSNIFGKSIEEIKSNIEASWIFNWQHDEHAFGAYSYPTPETTAARQLLNTPLEATVFFAGEAVYKDDYPGTVEAALVSGLEAAMKIH